MAEVASKLFATRIDENDVIVESLDRATDPELTDEKVRPLLGAAIDAGLSPSISDAELIRHPLAVWVETRLGICWSKTDQRWERAKPRTGEAAASELSRDAGRDEATCRRALRDLLLVSSTPENARTGKPGASTGSFFAFKLHQFISGAGHAYATLEAPGRRRVTVDGQQFLPDGTGEKRLYPLHFCRKCGQEYHPVKLVTEGGERRFLARDIEDAPIARADGAAAAGAQEDDDGVSDGEEHGFLTLHPADPDFKFTGAVEEYPDSWLEPAADGTVRLKSHYRKAQAQAVRVEATGGRPPHPLA